MKRKSLLSVVLFASLAAVGCKKKEEAKTEDTAAKPAEAALVENKAAEPTPAEQPTPTGEVKPAEAAPAGDMAAAAGAAMVEPSAEEKALAEKMLKMMDDMGNAAEANMADCSKAATALNSIFEKNKDIKDKAKALDSDPGKKAWFEKNFQGRMMGAMGKMMPLMEKCKDNAELQKVMTAMAS